MIKVLRLRDYPRLSYCLTVIADDNGINQLPPDQQVVPPQFLDRFNEGERQLLTFSDAQMDEFSAGEQDSAEVLELVQRAPEAHSILDDAFDGPFHDFVFEQTGSIPAPAE